MYVCMYVRTYASVTLRNFAVTSRWNVAVSRLRDREALCLEDLAPGRAKSLEENGAGPSGGGEGERGIFKHRGQGQARWAFRAWGSGR